MQNLIEDLKIALAPDASLFQGDDLLKNSLIERALRMDPELISMLVSSDTLRRHFFTEAGGVLIFDKIAFQRFVSNKAFLPDSYTSFKNKIGLMNGADYMKQSQDVVLAWPFKDCVLEGGMTKEDRARQEVFWNETLAPDDISRLFEPKVLTSLQRWDAEAAESRAPKPVENIDIEDNLLIKGNNLLALHTLKARYAGKVKLIYIDPPYNTGNDDFRYNDRFNHASWLTFMRNRLAVARDLLARNGAIFVSIGDREGHYLKVLMDEVFGRDNYVTTFVWQKVDSPNDNKPSIAPNHEFILCYEKVAKSAGLRKLGDDSILASYISTDEEPLLHRDRILRKNGKDSLRTDRESMWFPLTNPDGEEVWPIRDDGKEGRWSHGKKGVSKLKNENRLIWKWISGDDGIERWVPYAREFAPKEPSKPHPTILLDVKTSRQAQAHAEEIFGTEPHLETIKPEHLIARFIEMATDPNDIVLDFFVGSGTTAAVALKLGRRFVAIEQMDYIRTMTNLRLQKVLTGDPGGVSEVYDWQGGGNFVYAELMTLNERIINQIHTTTSIDALSDIRDDMLAGSFLRHDLKRERLAEANLAELPLEDAQALLRGCLDLNHLYVNIGDMSDPSYGISDVEQRINSDFQDSEI